MSTGPGVIGAFGRLLGDAGVNIAGMRVSRDSAGGATLVVLTLDSPIPADVLSAIAAEVDATLAKVVNLTDDNFPARCHKPFGRNGRFPLRPKGCLSHPGSGPDHTLRSPYH